MRNSKVPAGGVIAGKASRNVMSRKSPGSRRPFRVGRSKTGLGLFATKLIRRGSFIVQYTGRKLRNRVADELDTRYLFEINNRWTIDGSTRKNIARYVNHSCKPNAETDIKKHKIYINAIRTIHPGDEITYNYGRDYFNAFIKEHGCKCAACYRKKLELRAQKRRSKQRAAKRRKSGKGRNSRRH
jgi:uncharacterized protein